jgi:hypothetical protein
LPLFRTVGGVLAAREAARASAVAVASGVVIVEYDLLRERKEASD